MTRLEAQRDVETAQLQAEAKYQSLLNQQRTAGRRAVAASKVSAIKTNLIDVAEKAQKAVLDSEKLIAGNIGTYGIASGALRREIENNIAYAKRFTTLFVQAARDFKETGQFFRVAGSSRDPAGLTVVGDQFNSGTLLANYVDLTYATSVALGAQGDSLQGGVITNLFPNLTDAVAVPLMKGVAGLWDVVKTLGQAGVDMAQFLADILKKLPKIGGFALDWLPWVLAVVIIGPPLIRIILAGRRRGADAALEETGATLTEGREAITSGARKAGSMAVRGGKVAAAAYTGNPALAISGLSKRARRR